MSRKSDQKKNERRKRIERERNLQHNRPNPKFLLYVKLSNGWGLAKKFFSLEEVDAHIASIEDLRKRNASDIVEAVVVNAKTRAQVRHIAGHKMEDPAFIGKKTVPTGIQNRPGDIAFDTKVAPPDGSDKKDEAPQVQKSEAL